jgi:predicted  nucleic acid-binding Zn-ribbon protein
MMEKVLVLQDRDIRLSRLEDEFERLPIEEADLDQRLKQATTGADQAKEDAKRVESERKKLELEAENKRTQVAKYKTQLLEIKNNDQFHALQHEITAFEAEIRKIEDSELDLMEQYELAQKRAKVAQAEAADMTKKFEEQRRQLKAKGETIQKEVTTLKQERSKLAGEIDESVLSRYERIARSKGGEALVRISAGLCMGCHLKLTAQEIHNTQRGTELVTCTNCGRILYWMPE